jgi:membrane-associated protease RseP (regulator of RpoE activity)
MKIARNSIKPGTLRFTLAAALAWSTLSSMAAVVKVAPAAATEPAEEPAAEAKPVPESHSTSESDVRIDTVDQESARKEIPWLGVSTVEASDALAAQLNLPPGVGLLVTYIAPNSPAAKSGLRKNDVLAEFGDQQLVHPAQLRKLVRVQKEGESVKLGFYRGGKRDAISVALGKIKPGSPSWEEEGNAFRGNLDDLQRQLREMHLDDAAREQMRILRDSLGNIKIDQKQLQDNIRLGMEQARKVVQDALHDVTNSDPMRKVLENLAHSGIVIGDKADVVVRSSGQNVKSLVKSDDAGTIVLISNPRVYLTAHDKEGKLLFDGPVESAEERAKVPADLWDRVEPLVNQMRSTREAAEPKAAQ